MNLVIVESPKKANTINNFVGKNYTLESCYGHIRDLPKTTLGIDIEDDFEPRYRIPKEKKEIVDKLKKKSKEADNVIFATDEDREGEAIAWHLSKAIDVNDYERIVFHEITEPAIEKALENPRDIDMNLVNAQQARRILDRIVGYKLSPFLWEKVANKLSAGRVQSVALRIIAEREQEIRDFEPEIYYTISAILEKDSKDFESKLFRINGEKLPKPGIKDKEKVERIKNDLNSSNLEVSRYNSKPTRKKAPTPFITSTLQRAASGRLGFSAKQTMMFAQNLYENGLITYMRTDSLNLSQEALGKARGWIKENMDENYLLDKPRVFKTDSDTAQEAHEAIRPTNPFKHPEKVEVENKQQKDLYELIWKRFIGSQLPHAKFRRTTIEVEASENDNKSQYVLRKSGQVMVFDGFSRVWPKDFKQEKLPKLKEGQKINLDSLKVEDHETQPPSRYTEASLVKTLEKNGVGRPSTYASIISVIQERNYVQKNGRSFEPTDIGETVNQVLVNHFPRIVDMDFTAEMEEDLDRIAKGEIKWQEVVREFYDPFQENLDKKYDEVKKEDIVGKNKQRDIECEECGSKMEVKTSRYGKFLGCSNFPECKNTQKLPEDQEDLGGCPECENGEVVERRSQGQVFYGCSNYPDCEFAQSEKPSKSED
ncbi:MAG: type I DNA topoisomerase [Candidatus Magasanikbacteria bacterium]